MNPVKVSANLIVGSDGSTSINGSSMGLSNAEDRRRFQQLRLKSDLIVIGGNTARREPYKRTPIPLYILTHSKIKLQPKNQFARQFQLSPSELIDEIAKNFKSIKGQIPINILVESGPKLLLAMIEESLVDDLYLTVNLNKIGENRLSIEEMTKSFKLISKEIIEQCEFRQYKKLA